MRLTRSALLATLLAACAAPLTPITAQVAQSPPTAADSTHVKAQTISVDSIRLRLLPPLTSFCASKTARSYPTLCKAALVASRRVAALGVAESTLVAFKPPSPPPPPVDTAKKPPVDTIKLPPPPPSPGHPHEPAGFVQLSPTLSGDSLPLTVYGPGSGAEYELGWVQRGLTQQIDSAVPFASKKVLQAFFPSGMIGGGGPALMWPASSSNPQNWPGATPPRNARQLYMSFWFKISPGFPINLVANKLIYPAANGDHVAVATILGASADYSLDANGIAHFTPNQATQYNAAVIPEVCFSEIELDGNHFAGCTGEVHFGVPPEQWTQVKRGQWHHWETLYVLESDGGAHDGSAFLWLDGKLLVHWDHRIRFYPTSTTLTPWKWANWTTVYGGGGSVPNDGIGGYHRLKDLYVSGSSAASTQRIQIKKP